MIKVVKTHQMLQYYQKVDSIKTHQNKSLQILPGVPDVSLLKKGLPSRYWPLKYAQFGVLERPVFYKP